MAKLVTKVKYFWRRIITLWPSTPPYIVRETATTNPITIARFRSISPMRIKIVPVANVASETRTVSQPTNTR